MRILTLTDYYLPGFKAGGPLRTISAMAALLPSQLEFWVLTRDRDLTDRQPYRGVSLGKWVEVGNAKVCYLKKRAFLPLRMLWVVRRLRPDIVYANSVFSRLTIAFLAARWLGLFRNVPLIIAPRGELSPGALRLKGYKKQPFLMMTMALGFYRGVLWQASTELEKEEMEHALNAGMWTTVARNLAVAPDLRVASTDLSCRRPTPKEPGKVRLVFLSRVSPKKNLAHAIRILAHLVGRVDLRIFGPIDDAAYWRLCQKEIEALPPNVSVKYEGPIDHRLISSAFRESQFFVFPTLGENFGHVIPEALSFGCPVLVADTTPWRDLGEHRVGWVLPLDDDRAWAEALQTCVDMDADEYAKMSLDAERYARAAMEQDDAIAQNVRLFEMALERNASVSENTIGRY